MHPIFEKYWPLFAPHGKRFAVLRGGTGAGKTYHMYLKVLTTSFSNEPYRWLCLRKHRTNVPRSIWEGTLGLINKLNWRSQVDVNKSELSITIKANKNKIWFGGVDDPEKLKSIEGVTDVWMEECTEHTGADFEELNRRLRPSTPREPCIYMTFNPTGTQWWLYDQFFKSPHRAEKTLYLHTTYRDNPTLQRGFIEERLYDELHNPAAHRVYGLGEWGSAEGLILDLPQTYTTPPPEGARRWYGMDFGFNVPTALIEVAEHDGNYYVRELIYERGLTTDDIVARLLQHNVSKTAPIYCDAAEPARIEDIYRKGYNAKPARKDVHAGISFLKGLAGKWLSHSENVALHKELTTYSWRRDKAGKWLEEPEKANDHAIDALRYAMYTHLYKGERGMRFATK